MIPPSAPRLAVSAGIWRRGRVLLIQRARPPMQHLWTFPGGGVEPGETLREALAREMREEVALAVEPIGEPLVHEIILREASGVLLAHSVLLVFAARPLGDANPVAGDDAAAARFADPADLDPAALTPHLPRFILETGRRAGALAP